LVVIDPSAPPVSEDTVLDLLADMLLDMAANEGQKKWENAAAAANPPAGESAG
jgi:hypothetical protein